MDAVYCNYINIDTSLVRQFDSLWYRFHKEQSIIQHIFQNEQNNYAAVFNIWIYLLHEEEAPVLKPEKVILHAYDVLLMQKISSYIQEEMSSYFNRKKRDPEVIFLYAYALTAEIIKSITAFCAENPTSDVKQFIHFPYYYLTDDDLTETAEIYHIMKVLIAEFLHGYLTKEMVSTMHFRAMNYIHTTLQKTAFSR